MRLMLYHIMPQEKLYLREGTLLEGTVVKILPYGAQVKLGDSSRSGLLHISNITRRRIGSVSDVLQVDESVKVLVVKSLFPDKISLR
jgi:small subunit ribosomal protein S1